MSESTTTTTGLDLDLTTVEDGSTFAEGFDPASFGAEAVPFFKKAGRASDVWASTLKAYGHIVGIVLGAIRDKDTGHPVWSLASANMPQSARVLIDTIVSEAGISTEQASDLRRAGLQAWNGMRESYIAAYVLGAYEDATIQTEFVIGDRELKNYSRSLELLPEGIRAQVPEVIASAPLKPSKFSDAFKKGMAEQHRLSVLTLDPIYGGEKKGRNANGTMDKAQASIASRVESAVEERAATVGQDGGDSVEAVSVAVLRLVSALAARIVSIDTDGDGKVTNRKAVMENLHRASTILGLVSNDERTAEDVELIGKLSWTSKDKSKS